MKLEKMYEYLESEFGGFILAVPLADGTLRIVSRGVDVDFEFNVARALRRRMRHQKQPLPDYGRCTADGCNAPAVGRAICRTCMGVIAYCDEHGNRQLAHRDALRCEAAHRYAAATPEQREQSDRIKAGWDFWTNERMAIIVQQRNAGKTFVEIASRLDRPVRSVRKYYYRYLDKLERAEHANKTRNTTSRYLHGEE